MLAPHVVYLERMCQQVELERCFYDDSISDVTSLAIEKLSECRIAFSKFPRRFVELIALGRGQRALIAQELPEF